MPASASSLIDSVRTHAGADAGIDPLSAGPGLLEAFALVADLIRSAGAGARVRVSASDSRGPTDKGRPWAIRGPGGEGRRG
jgi:hypothetical protein